MTIDRAIELLKASKIDNIGVCTDIIITGRLTTRNRHTGKAILKNLPNYAEYDPIERLCLYEDAEYGLDISDLSENRGVYDGRHRSQQDIRTGD